MLISTSCKMLHAQCLNVIPCHSVLFTLYCLLLWTPIYSYLHTWGWPYRKHPETTSWLSKTIHEDNTNISNKYCLNNATRWDIIFKYGNSSGTMDCVITLCARGWRGCGFESCLDQCFNSWFVWLQDTKVTFDNCAHFVRKSTWVWIPLWPIILWIESDVDLSVP